MITFDVTSPAPRDVWRDIVANSNESVVFNSPEWIDCAHTVDRYEDASRLYEFSDGNRMVMPMLRRRYAGGTFTSSSSLPGNWGGMGGLVTTARVEPKHTAAVFQDLSTQPDTVVDIWPNPMNDSVWAASRSAGVMTVPRLSHVLSLEGGFPMVWERRFTSATRNHMRRAERSGLEIESASQGRLIPAFYELYSLSLSRWAKQQHEPRFMARWRAEQRDPLRKFHHIAQALGDALRVWIAWLDGVAAAGIIVLQTANAVYSWGGHE